MDRPSDWPEMTPEQYRRYLDQVTNRSDEDLHDEFLHYSLEERLAKRTQEAWAFMANEKRGPHERTETNKLLPLSKDVVAHFGDVLATLTPSENRALKATLQPEMRQAKWADLSRAEQLARVEQVLEDIIAKRFQDADQSSSVSAEKPTLQPEQKWEYCEIVYKLRKRGWFTRNYDIIFWARGISSTGPFNVLPNNSEYEGEENIYIYDILAHKPQGGETNDRAVRHLTARLHDAGWELIDESRSWKDPVWWNYKFRRESN